MAELLNVEDYDWELLEKFVENTDTESQISFDTYGLDETAEQLKQLIKIGKVMAQKYEVVVTNPPYMGSRNSMNNKLYKLVNESYEDSKADLYSVFIEKCCSMTKKQGMQAMITQHGWLFLTSFSKLRNKVLKEDIINLLHLGARAFDEINGEVVQTVSFVLRKSNIPKYKAVYCRLITGNNENEKKSEFYDFGKRYYIPKNKYDTLSEKPVAYWLSESMFNAFNNVTLSQYAMPRQGMATSDNNRFLRLWSEVEWNKVELHSSNENDAVKSGKKWFPYNKGGGFRKWYGNNDYLINWEKNGEEVKQLAVKKQGVFIW